MAVSVLIEPGGTTFVSKPFEVTRPVVITAFGLGEGNVTVEMVRVAGVTLTQTNKQACPPLPDGSQLVVIDAQPYECFLICADKPIAHITVPGWYRVVLSDNTPLDTAWVGKEEVGEALIPTLPDCSNCCDTPVVTKASSTPDSITIAVVEGAPLVVSLGTLEQPGMMTQEGDGPFLFTGLEADTDYTITATNKCGESVNYLASTSECPAITISETADTTTSVTVTISGGPAILTLGEFSASVGVDGSHTFSGLEPETEYTVTAVTPCGSTAIAQVATEACPPVVISQGAVTTNAITLNLVSGGPAVITLNGVSKLTANGASATFTGLVPGTDYTAQIVSQCDGKVTQFDTATAQCPVVVITQGAVTTNSVTLTVASGGPATIALDGVTKYVANGASATFTELTPGTDYTAQVVSACGGAVTYFDTATAPCPAVVISQGSATTNSITLNLVSGGPAVITINGVSKLTANGDSATFTELTPDTDYTAQIVSQCDGAVTYFDTATAPCPAVTASGVSPSPGVLDVTVSTGAPASVTVNGITRNVAADGGSVTFTGLTVGTTVSALVASACGNEGVFAFEVVDCPQVAITLSAVTETSFTVTVDAGGPADLEVRDASGNLLRAAYAVAVSQAFTGLPDGEQLYVTASSGCGSTVRVPVQTAGLPCASMLLKGGGYGYVDGDYLDTAATVVVPASGRIPEHRVYPTAGPGHTAPVYDQLSDTVIGYAANKSECAFEKCCTEENERFSYVSNIGALNSGGLCVPVSDIVLDNNLALITYSAVFQSRTQSMIKGSGTIISQPGGYISETFTNEWDVTALLTVDLIAQDNVVATIAGVASLEAPAIVFVHNVGDTLNVSPPEFGATNTPVPINWCYNQINPSTPVFDPVIGSPGGNSHLAYSPQTNSCRYMRLLAPGETVTVYSQWWAMWGGSAANDLAGLTYTLHGGSASITRLEPGVISA